ncbi:endopolygalacturonase [Pseudoduganella eburnea]|uniref:Endopolygalacturonase n=1 Tax=Massilia eburnea TaxID=1776165 RepID=A0A6L6QA80_9BURK|nr:endopolygalacturonase [Massilia eburnea]
MKPDRRPVLKAPRLQRRRLLQAGAAALLTRPWLPVLAAGRAGTNNSDAWRRADAIVAALKAPVRFRKEDFVVTHFGAQPCRTKQVKAWVTHDDQELVPTQADDAHDCYANFKAAIEACAAAGGGRVVIPKGYWYCAGPLVLRSNVHVHLQAGAHILFSQYPEHYAQHGEFDCAANGKLTLSRWQSNDCLNYSPMVYARDASNFALTGEDWSSTLDGQGGVAFNEAGECWWSWKGRNRTKNAVSQNTAPGYKEGQPTQVSPNPLNKPLAEMAPALDAAQRKLIEGEDDKWRGDERYLPALSEAGVPAEQRVFGRGHYLRPPMIHFINCSNVLLQGYHVRNTPFWQHHPVNCRNLVIRQVHAESRGPNSDGFDPEACDRVLVEDCVFDSGDDCIAIKAGKNRDTQYGPARNIVIQRCTMQSGHGAVTLGSEMSGGIEHVYARDLVFENAHWQTDPLNIAIRLKTNMNRGGYLRHFYVKNIKVPNGVQLSASHYALLPGSPIDTKGLSTAAGAVISFDCDYQPGADSVRLRPPEVSDVHIENVSVGNVAKGGVSGSCYQAIAILGPVVSDYNGPPPAPPVLPVRRVTIRNCDFGIPVNAAQPIWLYNVADLTLDNVRIGGKRLDTVLHA